MRADLPLGVVCAQLVHAAGETGPTHPGTHAVVLAARDEAHLGQLAERLADLGIPHHRVHEPDAPWNGALMAVGLYPTTDRTRLKSVLGRLPLIKETRP